MIYAEPAGTHAHAHTLIHILIQSFNYSHSNALTHTYAHKNKIMKDFRSSPSTLSYEIYLSQIRKEVPREGAV